MIRLRHLVYQLIIFILLLLLAYPSLFAVEVPTWYLQGKYIEKQTGYLFGTGSGRNLITARNNALADLAGYFSITVSNKSTSQEEIKRENSISQSSRFKQFIETRTKELSLSGAETDKLEKIENIYYTRIKISGHNLVSEHKKVVNELNIDLFNTLNEVHRKKNIIFTDIIVISQHSNEINNAKSSIEFLEFLNKINENYISLAEIDRIKSKLNALLVQYKQLITKIEIQVVSKNKTIDDFVNIIKNMLHNLGIKTITKKPSNDNQGKIIIDGNISKNTFKEATLVILNIEIELSNNLHTLGSKNITMRQFSPFSVDDAIKMAATKWGKNIPNNNILEYITYD